MLTHPLPSRLSRLSLSPRYAPLMGASEYVGIVGRYQALQQTIVAALITAPAGLLTYKTIAPAVAALSGGHGA